MGDADLSALTTTDGRSVDEVKAEQAADGNKMHRSYIILSEEERAKGFIRPVRLTYRHVGISGPKNLLRDLTDEEKKQYEKYDYAKYEKYPADAHCVGRFWSQSDLNKIGKGCGHTTTMSRSIAETYARSLDVYGATMCCFCGRHAPVGEAGEFVWEGTEERVGT